MKKIDQGKFEVFTTKQDAIDKFMKLQGVCRERINGDEDLIEFYCHKKGKIVISNPPTRSISGENSTDLFAEVVSQDGKTYVTYYTAFSKSNQVLKFICLIISAIAAVFAAVLALMSDDKISSILILGMGLAFFISQLLATLKEEKSSPKDSEILIKELEKKIEAVNLWDK